jgi:hypothetical protein
LQQNRNPKDQAFGAKQKTPKKKKKKSLNFAAKQMNRKSKQAFDEKQKMENFVQKQTP